jgi:hypothetical protein
MSISGPCIRKQFRDNPGACLAISLQAFKFGGDPFAFSNKAYIVNDQLAWEAQLVHSILNTSGVLQRRLRPLYSGEGNNRSCKIIGWLKGEDEPLEYESPTIANIKVKNSPLWAGDPDQQLFYFSSRAWARRHCPEVILGMYTPDEVQGEIIDMTPQHGLVQEAGADVGETIPWQVLSAEGEVYEFERSNSAIEACRKILIASAADPAKLATAWENNAGFIMSLGQEGLEPEAQAIERLYAELKPQDTPEIGQPTLTPAASSESGGSDAGESQHAAPPADAKPPRPPTAPLSTDPEWPHSPAAVPPTEKGSHGDGLAARPRQTAPAGETDLLGGKPAENLMVPLGRNDRENAEKLEYYARQILAMVDEAPRDTARLVGIRMTNENGIRALNAGLPERYDEVMAALSRK